MLQPQIKKYLKWNLWWWASVSYRIQPMDSTGNMWTWVWISNNFDTNNLDTRKQENGHVYELSKKPFYLFNICGKSADMLEFRGAPDSVWAPSFLWEVSELKATAFILKAV